jgi:hypothetical protein
MTRGKGAILLWTDSVTLPYLAGLLNRMAIKAIAASPFIRYGNKNHATWERRMTPLCN